MPSQEQWALDASIFAACMPGSKACANPAILFSPSGSFIDFKIQPEGAAVLEYLSKGEKVSTLITSSAATTLLLDAHVGLDKAAQCSDTQRTNAECTGSYAHSLCVT